MSVLNNSLLLGADAGGYTISRSLRFNSADSAYLSRTPASAGNRKTWTWAGWVKRSGFGADNELFATGSSDGFVIRFTSADIIRIYSYTGSYQLHFQTSAVYRDPSAWYHLVLAVDSTQATESNRAKLYINGVQVTAFSTAVYPSQNADLLVNAAARHDIGTNAVWGGFSYLSAYLADVHLVDGQALTPTSFGEFDANGIWQPKAFSGGSYGTNGFKLDFADNSSNTATTLGKDTSGNGNNWTPNNLSVTAGAGNDSLVDVPTNGSETDTGAGGQVRGNYATLNPLSNAYTLSNGNLDVSSNVDSNYVPATIQLPTSGKYYFEYTCTNTAGSNRRDVISVVDTSYAKTYPSGVTNSVIYLSFNGGVYLGPSGTLATTYSSWTNGDTVSCAIDCDTGKIWFAKNGTFNGSPSAGTSPATTLTNNGRLSFAVASDANSTLFSLSGTVNFGQRPFAYTAPSGFKSLCTANLPAPTITQPSTVMDVVTYSGTGSSRSITGLGFSPDWVWIKSRSNGAYHHRLNDTVRGATKEIYSNLTNAEGTDSVGLTAFNSDGFTLGSSNEYNASGQTFVGWCWDAGSSTVTNTAGSISSQVRANASAGFSIVTYTGNGTAGATVGHGLGVSPGMLIFKSRSRSTNDWKVWLSSFANTEALLLNSTSAKLTGQTSFLNSTTPTSSVITLGTDSDVNFNGATYVAYCFAPVAGYSSFGSYTGNGSTDGPFVYTGFRPRWVLLKSTTIGSEPWMLQDSARDPYNPSDSSLFPSGSNEESSGSFRNIDFTSNGFKIRTNDTSHNGGNAGYIYAAFAENPFQFARAR